MLFVNSGCRLLGHKLGSAGLKVRGRFKMTGNPRSLPLYLQSVQASLLDTTASIGLFVIPNRNFQKINLDIFTKLSR